VSDTHIGVFDSPPFNIVFLLFLAAEGPQKAKKPSTRSSSKYVFIVLSDTQLNESATIMLSILKRKNRKKRTRKKKL
jgi:hypothetical protein